MTRELVCLECPLPDWLPHEPGCLLNPKHKPNKGEEKIHLPGPWGIEETAGRLRCSTENGSGRKSENLKTGHVVNIPRFFLVGNRYHRWEQEDVEAWVRANKKWGAA
jgi:hypothetical protein